MAKYIWQGNVLTITLNDAEGAQADVVFDLDKIPQAVKDAAMRFGFKTALRNSTAGKMDELDKARKDLKAKAEVFHTVWAEEREGKAEVKLSDAEQLEIIGQVIVAAKQAKGDTRKAAEILEAFNALDDERKKAALASVQTMIDKRFKAKLKEKRDAAKQIAKVDDGAMKF